MLPGDLRFHLLACSISIAFIVSIGDRYIESHNRQERRRSVKSPSGQKRTADTTQDSRKEGPESQSKETPHPYASKGKRKKEQWFTDELYPRKRAAAVLQCPVLDRIAT